MNYKMHPLQYKKAVISTIYCTKTSKGTRYTMNQPNKFETYLIHFLLETHHLFKLYIRCPASYKIVIMPFAQCL